MGIDLYRISASGGAVMKIRKAVWSDLDSIMEIYQQARQLMVGPGESESVG